MKTLYVYRYALGLMLVLTLIFGIQASARAQQETLSNTTFDNWVFSCATQTADKDKAAVKNCEVRTTIVIQDEKTKQQAVAAVLAIGRSQAAGQSLQVAAQLPISALLNVPAKLMAEDEKDIATLNYVACQPQACMATGNLSSGQAASLLKTTGKLIVTYSNQAGQNLKIEVPSKGLSAALDALNKEKL